MKRDLGGRVTFLFCNCMQKRVNIKRLRLFLYLERPACKIGPWLVSRNLVFWRISIILR